MEPTEITYDLAVPTDEQSYLYKLATNYCFFADQLWKAMGWDQHHALTRVEYDMLDYAANGPPRRGILAPRGLGKALAVDTPIPTPSGWTTMGQIVVGDYVYDEKGKPTRVIAATDVMLDRPCFKVTFSDKTTIIADAEHLWTVNDRFSDKPEHTLTTAFMANRVELPTKREFKERRYRIDNAGPIECPHALLPVDPYVLGIWLGDGSSSCARLHFHEDETEFFESQVLAAGHTFSVKPNRKRSAHGCEAVISNYKNQTKLQTVLRSMGLINNKHIPPYYLRASIAQRTALLQGLMDTDGYVQASGYCELTTVHPKLRDGYRELVASLGLKVAVYTSRATINGKDCGEKYRIAFQSFSGDAVIPARMPRKKNRLPAESAKARHPSRARFIHSIEPIESVPVRCIQVDSWRSLYLASRSYIPTHNSHLVAITLPLYRWVRDPQRKIFEPSKTINEARKNVMLIREILDSVWFLEHLKPADHSLDTANNFNLGPATAHRQPSIVAIGIDGQTQGNRSHSIIPDDIETDENTKTHDARIDLGNRVHEFESILYPEAPEATRPRFYDPPEICYVGTFNHEESVYLKEAEAGFAFRTWPILYPFPEDKLLNLSPLLQADLDEGRAKPGDLVFPHRFDWNNVQQKQKKGRRYFNMQHMLIYETAESDRYPLRLDNILVTDLDPVYAYPHYRYARYDAMNRDTALDEPRSLGFGNDRFRRPICIENLPMTKYAGTHVAIDPAGTGDDKVGFTAISSLNGFLFVRKCVGLPGGYSAQNLEQLAQWCREVNANEIFIERTLGGGMFDTLLEPVLQKLFLEPGQHPAHPDGWRCSISKDTKITSWAAWSQKETRIIDTLEPVIGNHRMIWDTSVAANQALQFQFTRITRERGCLDHYDELDSMALCVRSWQHTLSMDTDLAASRSHERALEAKIAAHHARAVNLIETDRPVTWANKW